MSDEVNLHSRFLHALLEHVDPLSGKRENLEEFVQRVAQEDNFAVTNARVERESNHIDLLISNGHQAIVIENKIWSGDQHLQLQRYQDALVRQGYNEASIRLLYLTPHGHEPSDHSIGVLPAERIQQVSYREDLRDWLIGCQRRAFEEPELRESITQYRRLILRLTNNDYETQHMDELKDLLLRDDNVVLASQISRSLVDAEVDLVKSFYEVIDRVLREMIEDLPEVDAEYVYLARDDEIRRCVTGRGRNLDSGLHYRLAEGAWLFVGGPDRLWLGVYCSSEDNADLRNKLETTLANVGGHHYSDDSAPWFRWLDELPSWHTADERLHIREANEPTLRFLSSGEDSLEEFARSVASAISDVWGAIKKHGLLRSP